MSQTQEKVKVFAKNDGKALKARMEREKKDLVPFKVCPLDGSIGAQ